MDTFVHNTILIKDIEIDAYQINLPNANLILAVAPKGFVMCGYLDLATAKKLNDVACIVSGVTTIEELLSKPVLGLSPAAEKLGICCGISGQQALEKML